MDQTKQKPVGALNKVDAANYLSCSARYVDKLVASGQLKKGKLGRKSYFRIIDLDEILEQNLYDDSIHSIS